MRGYDAWLTTQPEAPDIPLPGDEFYPRCGNCGAFLKRDEFEADAQEWKIPCDGKVGDYESMCGSLKAHEPHEAVVWAVGIERRVCKRCGVTDKRIVA